MEIQELVETLKRKMQKQYPEKSIRRINMEITEQIGFDHANLFEKPKITKKQNNWQISQNNYYKVTINFPLFNNKTDQETFDQFKLKNPLFHKNSKDKGNKKIMETAHNPMGSLYQPYLIPQSGGSSKRKINLSNRGIIASQEIKESEFGKRKNKGSKRALHNKLSRSKSRKLVGKMKKKKSNRKFENENESNFFL